MDQIFNGLNYSNTQCTMYSTAKGQLRVTSTEKGQEMTLKMSTGRFKIPLCFILHVVRLIAYAFTGGVLAFGNTCMPIKTAVAASVLLTIAS